MKVHQHRSDRSTWCGLALWNGRPIETTRNSSKVTCKTCLKADAAEQRKQGLASA